MVNWSLSCTRTCLDIQNRLPALDHPSIVRLNSIGYLRHHLTKRATDMLFDGFAVHLRETRINASEPQVCVDEAKAHRSRGVNRLYVLQMASRLFLNPSACLFILPFTCYFTIER